MANIVNQAQTRVTVDGQQAANELSVLEKRAQRYRDAMLAANKAGDSTGYDKARKSLNEVNREMANIRRSSYDVNKVLNNLSTTGPKQLKKALNELNKELNSGNVARNSKEWNELQRKIRLVRAEIEKINAEQNASGSRWGRAAEGFNKYFGMVTAFMASITGLSFAFRKLAEDVAKMDDVYADVMKTTGWTRDQVLDLNETFKKMDTRTSRESLNDLARDAGKLGLTARKDVLDFVDAGNQINVALGEDLGEGAIKNIGKLTDVFALSTKELDNLDLKGKMLAIGSAINELGASSTASEAYMVNFAQRLGGVASQAGISIQNVLGYASALDQSGQAVEMSATAVQNFIMKLMSEPAKFAKIAGLEVSKFNNLLKTDTNAAIKQVLTALSEKGGFQALIPMFQEMGLDGARAVGVLSALATNINKVNEAQEVSNKAFSAGTSITNEYDVKNNNLQATLEKGRKAFKDAALELGERLSPALLTSTNYMTYMVKILPSVIDFFSKYGKYLLYVTTIGTAYIAGMKLQTLWNNKLSAALSLTNIQLKIKNTWLIITEASTHLYWMTVSILSGRLQDARRSFIAFNAVLKTNSIGLTLAVIAAVAGAIYLMTQRTKEMITAGKLLANVNKEATESISSEKAELDLLLRVAKNEKISKEERLKAIKRLNEISPEYLGNLNLENINTQEATNSVKLYTDALLKNAQAKSIQGKVEAEYNKKNDNLLELEKLNAAYKDLNDNAKNNSYRGETYVGIADQLDRIQKRINKLNKENEIIDENLATYSSFYEKTYEKTTDSLKKNQAYLENDLKNEKEKLSILEEQQAARLFPKENNTPAFSNSNTWTDSVATTELNRQVDLQRDIVSGKQKALDLAKEQQKVEKTVDTPKTPKDKGDKATKERAKIQNEMRKLEIKDNEARTKILEQFRDGEIKSEFDKDQKLLEQQDKYAKDRKSKLQELLKSVSVSSVKDEVNKQISEIDNQVLQSEIKRQAEIKKILLAADPAAAEQEAYDRRLQELGLFGVDREKLTKDQLSALELLEKQHQEKMSKIERPKVTREIKSLDDNQAREAQILSQKRAKGLMSERQYQHQLMLIQIAYAQKKLQLDGLTEDQSLQIKKDIEDKLRKLNEENSEIQDRLTKKKKLENLSEARDAELAFLDQTFDENLQNTEVYEQARLAIIQKYALLEEEANLAKQQRMIEVAQFGLDSLQQLLSSYSSYIQSANEAETAAINRKYEAQIKAAGNNSKRVKKLEEQRDKELKEVNRANEERSFKVQIAQALASTAQSAINAYSSTAAIPIVGPALAPIAAGVATAAGMINVAAIKKQHEAAMANYWDGGFTPKGNKYDIAGYVHKGEFVATQETLANPAARSAVNIIDIAQRNNTVSSLKASDFATAMEYKERIALAPAQRLVSDIQTTSDNSDYLIAVLNEVLAVQQALTNRLEKPFVTMNTATGDNGIKKALTDLEKMDRNIRRS